MTTDDPYLAVKEEVNAALAKTRILYQRWHQLNQNINSGGDCVPRTRSLSVLPSLSSLEELQWTTNELKNALRSIEWDLEDLNDCIVINEKNPNKFKVDSRDISMRRGFLTVTRAEVKAMKDKLNISRDRDCDRTTFQPINDSPQKEAEPPTVTHGTGSAKYSKLENETDSPNRRPTRLDIGNVYNTVYPVSTLSRPMNFDFDERMLDDCGNEMEVITTSRLDSTMQKMAKVLHMNNGNYNDYVPASNTEFAPPKPSYSVSLCSITRAIANCFVCNRN